MGAYRLRQRADRKAASRADRLANPIKFDSCQQNGSHSGFGFRLNRTSALKRSARGLPVSYPELVQELFRFLQTPGLNPKGATPSAQAD